MAHKDNVQQLPQPKGQVGTGGDHLLQTADDITGQTFNPDGCWSFNFTNPVGVLEPDYPAGYVEGIHSMTGSVVLNMDLVGGGAVGIDSLAFDGYVAPQKPIARQRMINPGDPATDGNHGPVDGLPNSGSYTADAASNWNFAATFDWCYDTPFAGSGTIDMTFNNYQWSGFIIPVSELTPAGMAATTLDDPLGYFGGTSQDFESWLLDEVAARLPAGAQYLLFTQGEAQPNWTHPMMGMTTDGIVGETIVAYAVPEPSTVLFFVAGLYGLAAVRRSLRGRDE
ncbi:MAG: PEP-CTERM sorting domain-containing protein [Planctomycetota bacterium]|nr:PEP-CTERM sorting domain-containing protein [Planctomycetota bacterium]